MKKNLNLLENLQDKVAAIPIEEWDAAARIVIEEKRRETGITNWLPKLQNGSREFEERVIALVKAKRNNVKIGVHPF